MAVSETDRQSPLKEGPELWAEVKAEVRVEMLMVEEIQKYLRWASDSVSPS